ncbi:MAG: GNAT family N-acetyltransferase [Rhodospirillales bacterium]|nr:GNAT family N-acetyltransferase [Rhodospirillales bacterium]
MGTNTARIEMVTSVTSPDDFLTAAFEAPCRSLVLPCDLDALADELGAPDAPDFVWTKIAGIDDPAFGPLTSMGFRIAVEEITYERPGDAAASAPSNGHDFTVHKLTPTSTAQASAIADEVGGLAARNMTTSRFHQDPLVPDDIAAEIKKRWAMNFFIGGRGEEMYVASAADDRVVGFNQVLVRPDCKVIDLICTADDHRRRGVARAIVAAMFEPGIKTRVGSQANNEAADEFYKSLDFEPVGRALCLHWHKGARI